MTDGYFKAYLLVMGLLILFSIVLIIIALCKSWDDRKDSLEVLMYLCILSIFWPLVVIFAAPVTIHIWKDKYRMQLRDAKERELKRKGY